MIPGVTVADKLKNSFSAAFGEGNFQEASSIWEQMKQQSITLSFMEQVALLGKLAMFEHNDGLTILNCGAFSLGLVLVGMTCLQNANIKESPYTAPLVERELMNAVDQNRVADASLILQNAKWCIDPRIKEYAQDRLMGKQTEHLVVEGAIFARNFLQSYENHKNGVVRQQVTESPRAVSSASQSRITY